jgi:hypothetical protein
MNSISLNCWGCGQSKAVHKLHHLVELTKPAVVFLMETRRTSEDHVWFEDRWMVASWCDE